MIMKFTCEEKRIVDAGRCQSRLFFMLLAIVAIGTVGCRGASRVTHERMDKGLVYVLHGIEGPGYLSKEICGGLDNGGVEYAIHNYSWSSVWGPLHNLNALKDNKRKARKLARRIETYQQTFPGRPVYLVGHSGGAAIAVWAAESLIGDNKVEGLVLLNASLSEGYDLKPAIKKTKRGIVNVHSSYDWMFLGIGTSIAGTMDRKHCESAGKAGFLVNEEDKGDLKLFQMDWSKEMAGSGHIGGHLSSAASHFVSLYVAPFLCAEKWNDKTLDRIKKGR